MRFRKKNPRLIPNDLVSNPTCGLGQNPGIDLIP